MNSSDEQQNASYHPREDLDQVFYVVFYPVTNVDVQMQDAYSALNWQFSQTTICICSYCGTMPPFWKRVAMI